jgi:hypothetical protein
LSFTNESHVLDPSDGGGASFDHSSLELNTTNGNIEVREVDFGNFGPDYQLAEDAGEGARVASQRFPLREITYKLHVKEGNGTSFGSAFKLLQQRVARIATEGGVVRRVLDPAGSFGAGTIFFDLLGGTIDTPSDWNFLHRRHADVDVSFLAQPLGRGAQVTLGTFSGTAAVIGTIGAGSIGGDVAALGEFDITEQGTTDRSSLYWGIQSRNWGTATNQNLIYEAESLTLLTSGSAVALTGASNGTAVEHGNLTQDYQAVVGMPQGGTYPAHIGTYKIRARTYRPSSNAGTVSVRFRWAGADLVNYTDNDPVAFNAHTMEDQFINLDLGLIRLDRATAGTQRWDGRVMVKSSSALDKIRIDRIELQPINEGWGYSYALGQAPTLISYRAADFFNQTAGTIGGKVLDIGGTWSEQGLGTAFNIDATNHTAYRLDGGSAGANVFRAAQAGTQNLGPNETVGGSLYVPVPTVLASHIAGVQARATAAGTIPHAMAGIRASSGSAFDLYLRYQDGSSQTPVSTRIATGGTAWSGTVSLTIDSNGKMTGIAAGSAGGIQANGTISQTISQMAQSGGSVLNGKVGIAAFSGGGSHIWDSFYAGSAATGERSALMFSLQQMNITDSLVQRLDSGGSAWADAPFRGDYLKLPSSGQEGRSVRFVVRASKGQDNTQADGTALSAADAIQVIAKATPRYLTVPE